MDALIYLDGTIQVLTSTEIDEFVFINEKGRYAITYSGRMFEWHNNCWMEVEYETAQYQTKICIRS